MSIDIKLKNAFKVISWTFLKSLIIICKIAIFNYPQIIYFVHNINQCM